MKTGVDTNVFSVLWSGKPEAQRAGRLLGAARTQGALVICPVVYAEMLANPIMDAPTLNVFLEEARIAVEFLPLPDVWSEAGIRYGKYAERRHRSGGGEARRLLADFVVGAHALLQTDRLLTFDLKRYRISFPELTLLGEERSSRSAGESL